MAKKSRNKREIRNVAKKALIEKRKAKAAASKANSKERDNSALVSTSSVAKKSKVEVITEKKRVAKRKSSAKIAGVKSVFRISSKSVIVTTFGRGNEALIEKEINNNNVSDFNENPKLDIDAKSQKSVYLINKRINNKKFQKSLSIKGKTDKPSKKSGDDLIGVRKQIEKEVFGETFEDNIRIQIGYAVFDVLKAIAAVSPNIVYAVNSLNTFNSENGKRYEDFIGNTLNYHFDYDKFFKKGEFESFVKNSQSRFVYYPNILCVSKKLKKQTNKKGKEYIKFQPKNNEALYNIFCVLNLLRNNVTHFSYFNKPIIFDKDFPKVPEKRKNAVSNLFDKQIASVNDSFFKTSKNNHWFIYTVLGAGYTIQSLDYYNELNKDLYNYYITKSYKNIGFSIKKLRETAIEQELINLSGESIQKQLKNNKSKVYNLIDFIIWYYIKYSDKSFSEEFVMMLRISENDEEKDAFYKEAADTIFSENHNNKYLKKPLSYYIEKLISLLSDENNYKNKKIFDSDGKEINISANKNDIITNVKNFHFFTKLIYFITCFLDGKEINILMTSLISKFRDIASFNAVVNTLSEKGVIKPSKYESLYSVFEDSGEIAEELSFLKSISKMDISFDDVNEEVVFKDAIRSLGVSEGLVDETYANYFKGVDSNIKSYIKNNIVKNRRFRYIIKYINPKDVNKITKNKAIVRFVLKRMPKPQIERYYNSINGPSQNPEDKLDALAKLISETDFNTIKNASLYKRKKGKMFTRKDNIVREHKKALLSLYYTIAYIFVKQMVQINSLYNIAIFYFERDFVLMKGRDYLKADRKDPSVNGDYYDMLTREFIPNEILSVNSRRDKSGFKFNEELDKAFKNIKTPLKINSAEIRNMLRYIANKDLNQRKSVNNLYRINRNNTVHLSVIANIGKYVEYIDRMDSYFEAYHFIAQSLLKSNPEARNTIESFIPDSCSDRLYSQPLLRAVNIPFGYTLPRYKNLSNEKLFLKYEEDNG